MATYDTASKTQLDAAVGDAQAWADGADGAPLSTGGAVPRSAKGHAAAAGATEIAVAALRDQVRDVLVPDAETVLGEVRLIRDDLGSRGEIPPGLLAEVAGHRPGRGALAEPSALLGDRLTLYWDWMRPTLLAGVPSSTTVDRLMGTGVHGDIVLPTAIGRGTSRRRDPDGLINAHLPVLAAPPIPFSQAASDHWRAGASPAVLVVGSGRNLSGEGSNVLWRTVDDAGAVLAQLDYNRSLTELRFRLVSGGVVRRRWTVADYDSNTLGLAGQIQTRDQNGNVLPGGGAPGMMKTLLVLGLGGPVLHVNGEPAPQTASDGTAFAVPVGRVQIGPIDTSSGGVGLGPFALFDGDAETVADVLMPWIERPMMASVDVETRPKWMQSGELVPYYVPETPRAFSVVPGPHDPRTYLPAGDVRRAAWDKLVFGEFVKGNVADLVYPATPSAPWDAGQLGDVDQTVSRPSTLVDPLAPLDKTRKVTLADGINAGHQTVAYRSTDSGVTHTRVAVLTPDTNWIAGTGQTEADRPRVPAKAMPASDTGVNNMVFDRHFGIFFDTRTATGAGIPVVPGGTPYVALGMMESYLGRQASAWIGAREMPEGEKWRETVDPTTWELIPVHDHPWPHVFSSYWPPHFSYGADFGAVPGRPSKPNIEDHWALKNNNRDVYAVSTRDRLPGFAPIGQTADKACRQFHWAESQKSDIQRFPTERMIPTLRSPNCSEQFYNERIMQVQPDLWWVLVTRYTDYDMGGTVDGPNPVPAGLPNADRNLQMNTDLYVSRDQGRTRYLVRRDLSRPQPGTWHAGIASLYPHPTPGKMWFFGSEGLHPEGGYGGARSLLAVADYTFPISAVPDRQVVTGIVPGGLHPLSEIERWTVDADVTRGTVQGAMVDAYGRIVPGYGFGDSRLGGDLVMYWRGSSALPAGGDARLVLWVVGAPVSSAVPVLKM